MKKWVVTALASIMIVAIVPTVNAAPSDYSLRLKVGPSFELVDYEHQVKLGGAFDYELGFGWGIGLEALIGIKSNFKFQLMPNVRFTFLYIGPAEWYFFGGLGYEAYEKDSAMGMKFGSGIILPLGSKLEILSDVSMNITPVGTPGTPTTMDWLLGIGFKFGGGQE